MGKTEKIITMEPVEKKRKSKKVEGLVIDEASGEGSGKESRKKKIKEKKRRERPEGEAVEEAGQAEAKDEKKKRKKRTTEGGEDVDDLAEGSSRVLTEDNNTADEARKEKKKKKRDAKQDTKDGFEAEPIKEGNSKKDKGKRKGTDHEEGSETSLVVVDEEISSKKKSKKRKERKDEGERITDSNAEDTAQKKKKKRKHSKSGFPDPEGDDSLSEQAKKALSYAYLQAEEPSSWKFNKARQNWLLRNIWSDEAISETHVPLANKYLAGVQGGVRETLVKTCRDILTAKPAPEVKTAEGEVQNETADTKKTVSFDVSDIKEESDTAAATLAMKQKRAQGLLDVLLASGTAP